MSASRTRIVRKPCENTHHSRSAAGAHKDCGHLFLINVSKKLHVPLAATDFFYQLNMSKTVQAIEKQTILESTHHAHLRTLCQVIVCVRCNLGDRPYSVRDGIRGKRN